MTCVDCGALLFPASPTSPAERRCQDCWWTVQHAATPADRHPFATWAISYREAS